jgi:hypothetical protein
LPAGASDAADSLLARLALAGWPTTDQKLGRKSDSFSLSLVLFFSFTGSIGVTFFEELLRRRSDSYK